MANKMLIDASHPEETRVVVLRGNRIEEFDFEAASKKQLRGNIYLAKVTRVEPSLQAAFIEYGGNRHGFLAFSEIHPDYYQIPVADRQALLEEEARHHEEEEEEARPSRDSGRDTGGGNGNGGGRRSRRHRRGGQGSAEKRSSHSDEAISEAAPADETVASQEFEGGDGPADAGEAGPSSDSTQADLIPEQGFGDTDPAQEEVLGFETAAETTAGDEVSLETGADAAEIDAETSIEASGDEAAEADAPLPSDAGEDTRDEQVTTLEHGYEAEDPDGEAVSVGTDDQPRQEDAVEQLGGDALEDVPHRQARPRRNYKIQEVIKRRQVLLVQVVKEERGNKGAALTTYLSLAGRYSVLMPNTARGGGISRKITDADDRKRLKAIAQELEVPDGMGIILRTAGAARGIAEVKRDFEYLMRMWETVRELTLKSSAPTLVYEEGSLIKRSIRDLYSKEVDEVVVAGDEGYREAREFMRLLMPGHTKNVIHYRDPQPIFAKAGAEAQLDAMFSNHVTLKSGGYLVINQTEALVAIDVNSGRSTREHNIEDTALRTNLEAADEVARQLRLRDLAGLIVVDFIDMEEGRNDRAVEKRIKDALKNDRARIQIGRISHFGLLEMSRQRMRTGVLEGSTIVCPHCAGSGSVRSISSIALHVLRMLEDTLIKSAAFNLTVRTRSEVALYILNQKRFNLLDLEMRFGVAITVQADPTMTGMVYHVIEHGTEATPPQIRLPGPGAAQIEAPLPDDELDLGIDEEIEGEDEEDVVAEDRPAQARDGNVGGGREPAGEGEGEGSRRRKRRRRRRGRDGQGQDRGQGDNGAMAQSGAEDQAEPGSDQGYEEAEDTEGDEPAQVDLFATEPATPTFEEAPASEATSELPLSEQAADEVVPSAALADEAEPEEVAPVEAPRRRSRRSKAAADLAEAAPATEEAAAPARRPRRSRARTAEVAVPEVEVVAVEVQAPAAPAEEARRPSADLDIEADTAKTHPADQDESSGPLATVAEAASSAVAKAQEVFSSDSPAEPEADRPKRSGWWQRAKATFSSGT